VGKDIRHGGHVGEATPGCDKGNVSHPDRVGAISTKQALNQVHRPLYRRIRNRRPAPSATPGTFETEALHQPFYGKASHLYFLPVQLSPDLASTVHLEALLKHTLDVNTQGIISLSSN